MPIKRDIAVVSPDTRDSPDPPGSPDSPRSPDANDSFDSHYAQTHESTDYEFLDEEYVEPYQENGKTCIVVKHDTYTSSKYNEKKVN